jgi:hypothetical protein
MIVSNSPLIKNGSLALNANGDLLAAPDIETQMTVAVSGYNCLYDVNLNSLLIPYLEGIPVGGLNRGAIINIVKQAYTYMVSQKIISNLQISIGASTISAVQININATDINGNEIFLNWIN